MKAKRVRFKDSEIEPVDYASSRFDACSTPCELREDLTMPPAASNEPKTSEFAFFKRLKQTVGHSSCQNTLNRHKMPVRNSGPTNHARELDKSKRKDVKSSQHIKKSTSGEINSFLSHRDASVESSAMPRKDHDNEGFKCSSLINTPTNINLDSFLSTTANASVNPDTLSGLSCDMVYLLLSRLLPENSQDILSQDPQQRLQETNEISLLDLDSNILLEGASDTSRKLVKASEDRFLDSRVSASQSHRIWGSNPVDQIDEYLDASAARNSNRMLLEHKVENEWRSSLNAIASGCLSNRFGDGNLLIWDDELHDYSTPRSTIHKENETYKHFSYDAYDCSQLCRFRDQNHSYELLNGKYDSIAAPKSSGSLMYEHEIHDFNLDRGAHPTSNCQYDSHSLGSFKSSRPFVLRNFMDCTEPNYLSDFEIRREPQPLLLGWDTNELGMRNSTHNSHMELEIYYPPLSTYSEDRQDSPEHEICCDPSTTRSKDHCDSLENSTLLHWSPHTCQEHDLQGHHFRQRDLIPSSPYVPFRLSYGPEQLNADDSGLFKSLSKDGSFFFIPQRSNYSMENMISERNYPGLEAFPISQDFESDAELKCKSLTGILKEQYEYTDNALEHFGRGYVSSPLLIASENSLATIQPESRSLARVHVPIECQEDSFPLQLHTLGWK
uniref:Uncharacterized protein n=1 Tax=Chenopodium quinoa TaxID=63459 RepID=A0A803M918_CHEQI